VGCSPGSTGRRRVPEKECPADAHALATKHAIRLDDIMETMFLLAINHEWRYLDSSGTEQPLTQEVLDGLYVKRRLSEKDLAAFDGGWQPA